MKKMLFFFFQFQFHIKVSSKAILSLVSNDKLLYQFHCYPLIEYIISKYHNEFCGIYQQLAAVADNIGR